MIEKLDLARKPPNFQVDRRFFIQYKAFKINEKPSHGVYIILGKAEESQPYASTSYYSSKIIFKDKNKKVYVVTIPVSSKDVVLDPNEQSFKNLHSILSTISDLKCDMYDNALVPIYLVNHLVSLANHPSSSLLEKFAKTKVGKN